MTSFQLTSPIDPSDSVFHPPVPPWSQCHIAVCGRRSNMWWIFLACKMVLTVAKLGQEARIFDGNYHFEPFDQTDFSETLGQLTFTVPVGHYLREVSCIFCSVIYDSIKGEHVCLCLFIPFAVPLPGQIEVNRELIIFTGLIICAMNAASGKLRDRMKWALKWP